ncbi:MAG: ubiquinol-cytochrome c reductase iron-sulfur subunit [Acidimicrobiaceae bacterium]|nr:ubiquinol-cytochrome c reductase iron-sulfur subunit [Acidimicrobiaceae bacterium]
MSDATKRHVEPADERRDERRAERLASVGFLVCTAAAVALAIVYASGGQPQLEGTLLAVAFSGLAFGFVTWAARLMPQGPFVQDRHEMASAPGDLEAFEEDLEHGDIERRTFLVRTLGLAAAALGVAAVFPIRSLGPKPGGALLHTPWRNGLRLVTSDGRVVNATDVPVGGLVTVFPEGHANSADGQAVLMRVAPSLIKPVPGREDWPPRGYIVYSKVCTHAGCPVGLFSAESNQLLCPCHQSTFDVLDGARPVFGPAAGPLPQLPLTIQPDGTLIARGDFSSPVGPVFWRRNL